MNDRYEIKSLTPACSGWWGKFTETDGSIWYCPVAAWALCKSYPQSGEYEGIYPVMPSEAGMQPVDQHCEILYLPNVTFKANNKPYCFAYTPTPEI